MLATGTIAPNFTLLDQNETSHTLSDYTSQWKIVYFYPKDDTPGCTKEACSIAEMYKDFAAKGIAVFGVSKDSPASHKKFAEKYNLPFTLLSDPDMETITAYEAFKPQKMFGKAVRSTHRISYLLDSENRIVHGYANVDPATHAAELLSDITKYQNG